VLVSKTLLVLGLLVLVLLFVALLCLLCSRRQTLREGRRWRINTELTQSIFDVTQPSGGKPPRPSVGGAGSFSANSFSA
jgi:hypothetical protein